MKVRLSPDARDDLRGVLEYITTTADPVVAERVVDRVLSTLRLLSGFPHLGYPGTVPETFEKLVPRLPFIIVYRVQHAEQELVVLRVYHTAQSRAH